METLVKKTLWPLVLVCTSLFAQLDGSHEPLCRAAQRGDPAQVRRLLDSGANPNIRDEQGQTPLMRASFVLGRNGADDDNAKAIPRDYIAVAKLLLDHKADVSARDAAGRTPLLMAMQGAASEYKVIGGDEELVRLLIARGADVNAHDNEGWTPLLKALSLWADQPKMIAFLIDRAPTSMRTSKTDAAD